MVRLGYFAELGFLEERLEELGSSVLLLYRSVWPNNFGKISDLGVTGPLVIHHFPFQTRLPDAFSRYRSLKDLLILFVVQHLPFCFRDSIGEVRYVLGFIGWLVYFLPLFNGAQLNCKLFCLLIYRFILSSFLVSPLRFVNWNLLGSVLL